MRPSLFVPIFGVAVVVACGVDGRRSGFELEAVDAGGPSTPGFAEDAAPLCAGLECKVVACQNGVTTTLKGKVFDPSGEHPLYNVMVYIPGRSDPETLPALKDSTVEPSGIACETCAGVVVNPFRAALTDGTGTFVMENVPVQADLPIVIQVGKWRRLLHVDVTKACEQNVVHDGDLRLPKNGSEGDMPQIAVTTGELDALECLLRGIGIDDDEFVQGNAAGGHVHLFKGYNGGMGTPAEDFWNDASQLRKFDMVLLSCEGGEYLDNKGGSAPGARGSMHEYLNAGGKVFATHFHYSWFEKSPEPEFQQLAAWKTPKATATDYTINQSFPKGQKLAEWLDAVGATTVPGHIDLENLAIVATSVNEPALPWITSSNDEPIYFTVNTPISNPDGTPTAPEAQCGRAVLTGLHVAAKGAPANLSQCSIHPDNLNAQQAALEFLFFDLSACVTNDKVAPPVPK